MEVQETLKIRNIKGIFLTEDEVNLILNKIAKVLDYKEDKKATRES